MEELKYLSLSGNPYLPAGVMSGRTFSSRYGLDQGSCAKKKEFLKLQPIPADVEEQLKNLKVRILSLSFE